LEATTVDIYFLAFLIQSQLKSAITASNQVSVHLTKRFQRRRFFKNWPIRKKELPVAAMFVNGSEGNVHSL